MTHNERQFVPLLQRLAVRRRLCVSGFASMSGDTGGGDGGLTTAERQRLKELEREKS
ncbi:Transposase (plasmid) [Shigella dysenteriae WRSd3]|uniref:Transposase n=1 Tax=Shigella dysenteriae WRSd3 TaxID=1401327 RepID=A0A090NVI9_SHIDY|nr:Transposase [Shigella dysenteriae WRSd3]ESU75938.1 Transposase [Shigella dysenteriae WRSd3]ESU76093.1 Transposase [Shigella dysenteriae WRSd3]ESU76113.1 Transposase [Shigella dysenteriae WRSd3]ESU76152.1 Transposase [Shigella dysenteriae WRSd3]